MFDNVECCVWTFGAAGGEDEGLACSVSLGSKWPAAQGRGPKGGGQVRGTHGVMTKEVQDGQGK